MQSDKTNRMLVDSVHLQFGSHTVLQSAFLTAESGRVTGVLGRNGTGKSCMFKCIVGGLKPQNMFVRFNDEPKTDYAHIGGACQVPASESVRSREIHIGRGFQIIWRGLR